MTNFHRAFCQSRQAEWPQMFQDYSSSTIGRLRFPFCHIETDTDEAGRENLSDDKILCSLLSSKSQSSSSLSKSYSTYAAASLLAAHVNHYP
jgi:hypothetical protein